MRSELEEMVTLGEKIENYLRKRSLMSSRTKCRNCEYFDSYLYFCKKWQRMVHDKYLCQGYKKKDGYR